MSLLLLSANNASGVDCCDSIDDLFSDGIAIMFAYILNVPFVIQLIRLPTGLDVHLQYAHNLYLLYQMNAFGGFLQRLPQNYHKKEKDLCFCINSTDSAIYKTLMALPIKEEKNSFNGDLF